jgi:hypothetical protein
MKTILFALTLLFGTVLCAQEKKAAQKTKTAIPQNSTGACYTDKTWKLKKVEKFSIEKDPKDEQKNDFLLLKGDNTFKLMLNGIDKFGTYTKSGAWLNLKPEAGDIMPFKIISCDGGILKADYRDGDTHNNFTYSAQ